MNTKHCLLLTVLLSMVSCSDCGNPTIGAKQGEPTKWESISLGLMDSDFVNSVATLVELKPNEVKLNTQCNDKVAVIVPDIGDLVMEERSAGGRSLETCYYQSKRDRDRSSLIDIRGVFLDKKLVRLSYRLAPMECGKLKQSLADRFGTGLEKSFEERLLLGEEKRHYSVWRFEKTVWTMTMGEVDTCILTQLDMAVLEDLPEPPPPSKKGEPVSLDDLGIGKLDLNAALPEIDTTLDVEDAVAQ